MLLVCFAGVAKRGAPGDDVVAGSDGLPNPCLRDPTCCRWVARPLHASLARPCHVVGSEAKRRSVSSKTASRGVLFSPLLMCACAVMVEGGKR